MPKIGFILYFCIQTSTLVVRHHTVNSREKLLVLLILSLHPVSTSLYCLWIFFVMSKMLPFMCQNPKMYGFENLKLKDGQAKFINLIRIVHFVSVLHLLTSPRLRFLSSQPETALAGYDAARTSSKCMSTATDFWLERTFEKSVSSALARHVNRVCL